MEEKKKNNICNGTPKASILRCQNKVKNISFYNTTINDYCGVHAKVKRTATIIKNYDGTATQINWSNNQVIKMGDPIDYLELINERYQNIMNNKPPKKRGKKHDKSALFTFNDKEIDLIECGRLIKEGNETEIGNIFHKLGFVDNIENFSDFCYRAYSVRPFDDYQYSAPYKNFMTNIRKFLGVSLAFCFKFELLSKLQAFGKGKYVRNKICSPKYIKTRVKYNPHINSITKIQRWAKKWTYYNKMVIKPDKFVHFCKNINKITELQVKVKYNIKRKIKNSYGCPYSLMSYSDIPSKYRIVYKHKVGNNIYWRYYNIFWLYRGLINQASEKPTLYEPSTKTEYPDSFIVKLCKRIWHLTRIEKKIMTDDGSIIITSEEPYFSEYNTSFMRRSKFSYYMMMLDLDYKFNNMLNGVNLFELRDLKRLNKYRKVYLNYLKDIYDIAREYNFYDITNCCKYRYDDMFSQDYNYFSDNEGEKNVGNYFYGIALLKNNIDHLKIQYPDNCPERNSIIQIEELANCMMTESI